MKSIFIILIVFGIQNVFGQADYYNLDFEKLIQNNTIPNWQKKIEGVDITLDSVTKFQGKYSLKMSSNNKGEGIPGIENIIAKTFEGKEIELSGYLKTENVQSAYIYLIVGDEENQFSFDMSPTISGTTDWKKLKVKIPYTSESTKITIASNIEGSGEVWLDDFVVNIDGKNIQSLKEVKKELSKAQLDKKFDNGSLIELSNLEVENIENLELLGRVWGFLKYYHPEIAKGNYNWDYELFRFLPRYIEMKNDKERDKLIITWIESLSEIVKCSKCKPTAENAVLKPDLKWVNNQDENLKKKLLYIYNNRSQGKQYYIEMVSDAGNPDFKNETAYSQMSYPDDGFRLLSLYRYWNMINYFFPYKPLMDKDWNTTLGEYIPIFLNAKNELEYEMAALAIIGDIQDTHANLSGGGDKIDKWKGVNYPPVLVRFIENHLIVTDYYKEELRSESGLKIGDIITKINDIPIEQLVEEKSKYYPASNVPTRLRDFSKDILRSNATKIGIDFISGNSGPQSKSLKLYPKDSINIYTWYSKDNDKPSYKMLDNNIGYITLGSIKDEDIKTIKKKFKNTKGIIIDIRNYPSTFVPFSLGSYFVSSSTPFVKFSKGNIDNPGEFAFTDNLVLDSRGKTYKGKLVVLLNELSQSQAEYTAMAFRAGDNTTIIGSTTAGADGNISTILLPGGLRTMISGIGVNYRNGKETQRIGIVPDIEVKPTIEGIRDGKDELLEKAIEVITKE